MALANKYVVVRANSTSGAFVVARNTDAPRRCDWSKADIAGYASSLRVAERIAQDANVDDDADDIR